MRHFRVLITENMSEKEISVLPTKPVRPDAEEVKVQTQKLTETIEKYATRIQEIKELTANRKGSRSHPSEKERTLAKSLQETRNTFQATLVVHRKKCVAEFCV